MPSPADISRDSGRRFLQSHPWIRFALDLRDARVPWQFWEQLGEARAKCQQIAKTPLPPAISQRLSTLYLAKGALATTAIEGNMLSEQQALDAVQGQLQLPVSQEYQRREIENIVDACAVIEREVHAGGDFPVTPDRLAHLNGQVLDGLELPEGVVAGGYRDGSVVVGNVYRGAPAGDCEFLVKRMCEWLNGDDFRDAAEGREAFVRAFLRAVVAHVYIAWIHPFGDGNGRTARLVEFGIMTAAGIPSVSAHLLSNHYNLTRDGYYRELAKASESEGDLVPFLAYAAAGFADGLEQQLEEVRGVNYASAWREYVDETFAERSTPATRRQRALVLALPHEDGVARTAIPTLTPELARMYADKGAKTVTRDLNALTERGLIERGEHGVRARAEVMLGFVPQAAGGSVL
jgi:Fic family protein